MNTEMTTGTGILFPISKLPEFNKVVKLEGYGKIVFTDKGKSFPIPDDAEAFGHSYAAGYDGDLGCYCYYREATKAEKAEAKKKKQDNKLIQSATNELYRLRLKFDYDGTVLENVPEILGQRTLGDGFTGDFFIISDDKIWHLRHEHNNCSRVWNYTFKDRSYEASFLPRTSELDAQINDLIDILMPKKAA